MSVTYGIVFSVCLLCAAGCTATCLRDSDCMGASICTENRCILLVGSDAGRSTPPPSSETPDTTDATTDEPASDAGVIE